MAVDEQLDRLSRELNKQSLGPIDTVSNEVVSRFWSTCGTVAASLRQAANDQPLITLLLASQVGYLVARLQRRSRAKRAAHHTERMNGD